MSDFAAFKEGVNPYHLATLYAFVRLGKPVYEGTAKWDPDRKRKRRARQAARRRNRT